jgi:hypothetical protein
VNHLKLYREIQARPGKLYVHDIETVVLPKGITQPPEIVPVLPEPTYAEHVKLDTRATKAESAERDAWAQYRSIEVEIRAQLLDAEYLSTPQAEGRYTVLEGQRYAAEHKASTASGRAREARRQEMAYRHDLDTARARSAFYDGTVRPLGLKLRFAREVAA